MSPIISHHPSSTPTPLPLPEDHYLLATIPLAGAHYHTFPLHASSMTLGQILTLIPEPANPHDPHAVRIHWEEKMIGYLPRQHNRIPFRLLQQQCPLTARIAWFNPESDPPLSLHLLLPHAAHP